MFSIEATTDETIAEQFNKQGDRNFGHVNQAA